MRSVLSYECLVKEQGLNVEITEEVPTISGLRASGDSFDMSCEGILARCVVFVFAAGLFSACSTTPAPEFPATIETISEVPEYSEFPDAEVGAVADPNLWWRDIGGSELADWVTLLRSNSFELSEARERVEQARELARQALGGRLPGASVDLGGSYNRTSDLFGNFDWGDQYTAGLVASWDTDIFGGLRTAHRAALLSAEAARLNYLATENRSIEALARAWITAAILQRRLALAKETAANYRTTYNVTEQRYNSGSSSTSATDVLISRQNLEAALAEIPAIETQLATQLLAVDQQLAMVPGTTAASFRGNMTVSRAMMMPVGFPATLLTARPDVAAAELSYRAALEDIGTARADLLPSLTLSASFSFQEDDPADLFDLDRYIASLAASLMQPIFQGGRLRSRVRVEESQARELATAYARIALSAFSEVETALVRQSGALRELEQLEKTLKSAQDSNQIAQFRYLEGLQPLLAVLETQRGLTNAQQSIISAEQSLLEARIALHLALGGSWFEGMKRQPSPMAQPQPGE